MERDRERFLEKLEDPLSRASSGLADRKRGGEQAGEHDRRPRLETLRQGLSHARHALAEKAHENLARARATVQDLARDYEVAPPRTAPRREELEALRRHLQRTAHLIDHLANLDDPDWVRAHEEYERSWDEVMRAFEGDRPAAE